ncbi:hypothetical protein H5410_022575 [Solanum commersonii]|uniref:Uncharacterized protein n=1 Tax=Solanum commersonii TaxID=4109 RepID=A0A9J5ZJH0_SOLCO|nr:hypothetical protein H5410_022575 [Solanum commersonii]
MFRVLNAVRRDKEVTASNTSASPKQHEFMSNKTAKLKADLFYRNCSTDSDECEERRGRENEEKINQMEN